MKVVKLISLLMFFAVFTACDATTELTSTESDRSNVSAINNQSLNTPPAALHMADKQKGLATFRQATARYHDVEKAIEDGFEMILPCTENPEGPGGLGVVYAKLDRFDTVIDLSKPEILFYEPKENGDLQLLGGEPVVPIEQWNEIASDPPSLFGQEFHRNEEHGLYGLHMWVWKGNPEGVFAFWHPNVSCEHTG